MGTPTALAHPGAVEREPWTSQDVVAIVVVQVVGLAIAYVAGWIAFFDLPDEGLFSAPNDGATRAWGVVAAIAFALCLPAGCWEAWRRRRHPAPAVLGGLVVVGAAVAWTGWAFQLGWG